MGIEYEAKFLDIDVKKMRKKIEEIGGKMVHENIKFIRSVFALCGNINGYYRIRDEGNKVTMTIKTYENKDFPEEHELSIHNTFEEGVNFIKKIGITQTSYQETYRELWSHPLAHEITFDMLPGIPTYMEIDCESLENLNKLIKLLELDETKKRYGAFGKTYEEYYGIPEEILNKKTPSITFKNIINEINPTKNQELLKKITDTIKWDASTLKILKTLQVKLRDI